MYAYSIVYKKKHNFTHSITKVTSDQNIKKDELCNSCDNDFYQWHNIMICNAIGSDIQNAKLDDTILSFHVVESNHVDSVDWLLFLYGKC